MVTRKRCYAPPSSSSEYSTCRGSHCHSRPFRESTEQAITERVRRTRCPHPDTRSRTTESRSAVGPNESPSIRSPRTESQGNRSSGRSSEQSQGASPNACCPTAHRVGEISTRSGKQGAGVFHASSREGSAAGTAFDSKFLSADQEGSLLPSSLQRRLDRTHRTVRRLSILVASALGMRSGQRSGIFPAG